MAYDFRSRLSWLKLNAVVPRAGGFTGLGGMFGGRRQVLDSL